MVVVVVASYRHLAQFFIYTEIKSRRGAGRFAGRVKYSRVLGRLQQRYSHRLKLAEGTLPRGLTYHCTDEVRYI